MGATSAIAGVEQDLAESKMWSFLFEFEKDSVLQQLQQLFPVVVIPKKVQAEQ